jgi:hypothetical protein
MKDLSRDKEQRERSSRTRSLDIRERNQEEDIEYLLTRRSLEERYKIKISKRKKNRRERRREESKIKSNLYERDRRGIEETRYIRSKNRRSKEIETRRRNR